MVYLTVTFAIQHGFECLRYLRMTEKEPHNDDTALADGSTAQSSEPASNENTARSYTEPSETLDDILNGPVQNRLQIGNPIRHAQVLALSKELKASNIEPFNLDTLLRGSYIWTPPKPETKEPTFEYKELMARLRREQEAREYQQMINPVPPAESTSRNLPRSSAANAFKSTEAYIADSPDDEATYADINRQVTLIINVLISIVACSAALWMVSKWWSTPARLALSFGGSILVAVAEVAIYWGYIYKVKESIKTERKIVEKKTLVRSWTVGQGGDEDEVTMADKDSKIPELIEPVQKKELIRKRKK